MAAILAVGLIAALATECDAQPARPGAGGVQNSPPENGTANNGTGGNPGQTQPAANGAGAPNTGGGNNAASPGGANTRQRRSLGGGDAPADGSAATGAVGNTADVGKFPPIPARYGVYVRGNLPAPRGQGTGAGAGYYISLWLLAPILILFLIWAASSHWVDDDSRSLNMPTDFWNSVLLTTGVVGFLAVLLIPMYLIGLPVLLLSYAVPIGFYVADRNSRVPESAKVLTPQHIQKVVIRTLAKVGIHIGSEEAQEKAAGPPITFIGKSITGRGYDKSRSKQVENSRGYMSTKELMYDAILRRATDVHLEPKDEEHAVRIRIDGVMYPTEPFDTSVGEAVVNVVKVLCAMDITERRRPQDGSFRAELEGRHIDFRVATQGTRHGEKLSLRILDQANAVSTLVGLGLRKQLKEQLLDVINSPHGTFLCCGPTGAGKSTTLYACMNEIDTSRRNVISVEDPVEYKIDGVNQIEINTKSGQDFASTLRSILRQDPDVVMVGEIRDGETAKICCQAANTGHMVFSTVHANDTITALYRLLELEVEPFMVANSISAIMGQRLARRLCPECREAYRPKPEFLKKAGLPPDKVDKFYRPPKDPPSLCPKCGGLGFYGRVGVFELLLITERMQDMIRDKAPMSNIKAEARKNGMLTMREEGLRLVVRGLTSVDELLRVVK